jgi:PKD repeat protein
MHMIIAKGATVIFLALLASLTAQATAPLETSPYWTSSELGVYTTGMVWRDCNNDGVIDVFFSCGNDMAQAANMIYLSNGGTLPETASWYSSNEEYSGHCAVGDINDDGFADMIVANYLGSSFSYPNLSDLYLNQGGLPNHAPSWQTPDSMYSFSCALGDYDGDGDLDIAFATGEGYNGKFEKDVMYRNDNGAFADAPGWRSAAATTGMDVAWGDVDNDGDLDLAFTYSSGAPTALFYNDNGMIETTPSWQASTTESGNTLIFADINGDDWLDLVVAYNNQTGGTGRFRVYFNDGAGHLSPNYGWQSSTGGYGAALAVYDYDGDGDDDLATGRWFSNLAVYENLGTTLTTSPVWVSDLLMVAEDIAWVDVNGYGVMNFADTFLVADGRKLFYSSRHPLYAIDSVYVDGDRLGNHDFCYDLVSGWVSLAQSPVTEAIIHYRYSAWNDLAVCNWDTVNMVFRNANEPLVDFNADVAFGPVPLTVQFTNTTDVSGAWLWDFGDGHTSTQLNASHTYQQPGYYDVSLTLSISEGDFSMKKPGVVSAYADTLRVDSVSGTPGQVVRVDIFAHNKLPLSELVIPITWSGPLNLSYYSDSTSGLRTDYFAGKTWTSWDPTRKRGVFTMTIGSGQPYLPAGDGAVLSLYLRVGTGVPYATNPITTAPYSIYAALMTTYAGTYTPESIAGAIRYGCCTSPTLGNLDHSVDGLVTMGDLTVLIDHLYISLTPLPCPSEGNVDQSVDGLVTMGDLTVMIDHLYISLTPLAPCP